MKEITSPLLKQIQHYNKNLQIRANIEGWDRNKYLLLQLLKRILINETKRISNKNWTDALKKIEGRL